MTAAPPPGTLDEPRARPRPIRRLLAVLAAVAVILIAMAVVGAIPRACACSQTAPPLPPSPVVGVVVGVDSSGLGSVSGFSLRLTDGTTIQLDMGTLENATEFSPSHLAEHQVTGNRVRAFYRDLQGVATVYRLEDAPG